MISSSSSTDRPRLRTAPLGVAALAVVLAILPGACASSGDGDLGPPTGPEDLTNLFLSPQYSQWLVGPIARMIAPGGAEAYLALRDDLAAADFIEAFWRERPPGQRQTFEVRADEADRRFTEAGYSGRRTARGMIHILYGEPEETEYEIDLQTGEPYEIWRYGQDAPAGLDGRRPTTFRFQKTGDITTFYRPRGPRVVP